MSNFVNKSLEFGREESGYKTIKEGIAEGELIGGNLTLTSRLVCGKYKIDFTGKILFLEELGLESDPAACSRELYFMKRDLHLQR